ncbi:unnamed protein product [Effrenium voratum]|nr:unnamed protein product [Effrenium voratum]
MFQWSYACLVDDEMGGVRRRAHRCRKEEATVGIYATRPRSFARQAEPNEAREKPAKRTTRSSQGIKPDLAEVLQCIETLYVDKLKPFGRILRKRVAERHVQNHVDRPFVPGSNLELPDVDIKHLKGVCEASDLLDISPEEGGDWSATFKGRSQRFVDIYSPFDDYSPVVWQAAKQYFECLPEEEALLPGGRYSCAQALVQRHLPFLSGFSLGEVCHLVQLAISKHKILGYCNGAVVPYSRSQSRVKEECAESQQPCAQAPKEDQDKALSLASLEKARECLREILENAEVPGVHGPSMIPLSNVKRLFRSRYQTELSETALGHSKLSELLQDQRFSDICEVQLQGQGYIVVQREKKPKDRDTVVRYTGGPIGPSESKEDTEGLESLAVDCALTPVLSDKFGDRELREMDEDMPPPTPLQPTPLASPGTATPNTASRWPVYNLWPFQMHAHLWGEAPPLPLGGKICTETNPGDTDSTADSARSGERPVPHSPAPSSGNLAEAHSPEDAPMKVELSILQRMHAAVPDLDEEEPRARIPFCPGEPLTLEDVCDRPPGLQPADQVKNTFIHSAATPLVTPEPGAYRRSQSVPKEVGHGCGEAEMPSGHDTSCGVVPSPAFLPPPTPSSPLFSRGYEAILQLDHRASNREPWQANFRARLQMHWRVRIPPVPRSFAWQS